ncbi:MAG: hypothetical protein IJY50_01265 [Clostridia bacterium]|nr:hypothetical protein [Clostridia bacterium]
MNKALLGIDLGTSSVKVLLRHGDGRLEKAKATYAEISPNGWLNAIKTALRMLDLRDIGAIGLSAQTGTYIVNGKNVIGWGDSAGKEELPRVRGAFSPDTFLAEIGMPHPAMTSYPLPRLLYIKEHFDRVQSVCQPKDLICAYLTGTCCSDVWTWRGLACPEKGGYSLPLLQSLGLDPAWLPPLRGADAVIGNVTDAVAAETGLPAGTPVVAGLNDFFAGLVGMGVPMCAPLFDITGTSEHFGVIENALSASTPLVAGRYLTDFVHYGGTASSGPSLAFALKELGAVSGDPADYLAADPPLFLPYLNGERAPIFDPHAKGVFFGMGKDCTKELMSYAVLEGVAFSIYHIAKHLGQLPKGDVLLGGGAANDGLLCSIKATLFDRCFVAPAESDTSALGAAMMAGLGIGTFADLTKATTACVQMGTVHPPLPHLREKLLARFAIYEKLYPAMKPYFEEWKEI